mmetsp:Transcript_17971/g.44023  ORF Transcript_17971/g.44023 Transcript_17971/m.44023 type:complete len:226 (+) Transcript_17971:2227-2904(+)
MRQLRQHPEGPAPVRPAHLPVPQRAPGPEEVQAPDPLLGEDHHAHRWGEEAEGAAAEEGGPGGPELGYEAAQGAQRDGRRVPEGGRRGLRRELDKRAPRGAARAAAPSGRAAPQGALKAGVRPPRRHCRRRSGSEHHPAKGRSDGAQHPQTGGREGPLADGLPRKAHGIDLKALRPRLRRAGEAGEGAEDGAPGGLPEPAPGRLEGAAVPATPQGIACEGKPAAS